MSVDLKVLVLSVVCHDLWYAKITRGERQKSNSLKYFFLQKFWLKLFLAKNGNSWTREFWSTPILAHIYIYIYKLYMCVFYLLYFLFTLVKHIADSQIPLLSFCPLWRQFCVRDLEPLSRWGPRKRSYVQNGGWIFFGHGHSRYVRRLWWMVEWQLKRISLKYCRGWVPI